MTGSYRPSKAQLYIGTASTITALNPFVDTGYSLQGVGTILRRNILGQVGRTADGVDAGQNGQLRLRHGSDITEGGRQFLVLYRTDAADCLVVPVIVASVQLGAAPAGVVTDVVSFVQDGEGSALPVFSDNVKTSGTVTLPTNGVGYDVVTTGGGQGVKLKTASFSVTGAFGVGGPPMIAEGN